MKVSDAMLAGYAKAPRQCYGTFWSGGNCRHPHAVCAAGAALLGAIGLAHGAVIPSALVAADKAFQAAYGCEIETANDGPDGWGKDSLPIDVIAGMLRAIGH